MTAREFIQGNALAIVGAVAVAAAGVAVVQTIRIDGFHVWPVHYVGLAERAEQVAEVKADLGKSEQARSQEQAQASASYAAQSTRCDDRITTARDSAAAIQEIVNGSHVVAAGDGQDSGAPADAVRGIIGADMLRRVAGQAGGAASLPAGNAGGSK